MGHYPEETADLTFDVRQAEARRVLDPGEPFAWLIIAVVQLALNQHAIS